MAASKTRSTRTVRPTGSAKSARATRTRAEAPVLTRLRKPLAQVIADARETSQEFALAGLGLAAQIHKQREQRMAQWVAEGKRVEPKVRKAVEDWKETVQSKLQASKSKLKIKPFDLAEIRRRLTERSVA